MYVWVYVCVSVYESLRDVWNLLLVCTVHLRRTTNRLRRNILNTFRSGQGTVFSRKMFLVVSQPPHNLNDS